MLRFLVIVILFFPTISLATINSVGDLETLVSGKKYASAIKAGEQLLKQQPLWPEVQFLTAYAYQMKNQSPKATTMYQELIHQHPELPEPRNNLAMIYLAKGDYDAASKLLVEAIQTHKSYATAYQNLSRIYTAIASEAYRRALSESKEPAKYTHKIMLTALSQLEPVSIESTPVAVTSTESSIQTLKQQEDLNSNISSKVKQWAKAWSDKDFVTYTDFYSTEHRPNFETHSAWVEHQRQRIMRPGFIKIGVSDFRIRAQHNNRAIIDFMQSFDSPNYSDRVVKRLGFRQIGTQWKIIDERVLSVLRN